MRTIVAKGLPMGAQMLVMSLAGLTTMDRGALERTVSDAPESSFEDVYGAPPPTMYAMAAKRHMHEFGTTSEQFGAVAVACRKHASLNPNATFRRTSAIIPARMMLLCLNHALRNHLIDAVLCRFDDFRFHFGRSPV